MTAVKSDPFHYETGTQKKVAKLLRRGKRQERIAAAEAAGIDRSRILVDIGFGFGKIVFAEGALAQRIQVANKPGRLCLADRKKPYLFGISTCRGAGRFNAFQDIMK
jgi:dihydropteroate synthase